MTDLETGDTGPSTSPEEARQREILEFLIPNGTQKIVPSSFTPGNSSVTVDKLETIQGSNESRIVESMTISEQEFLGAQTLAGQMIREAFDHRTSTTAAYDDVINLVISLRDINAFLFYSKHPVTS